MSKETAYSPKYLSFICTSILACFAVMLLALEPLDIFVALEGYNLSYIIFLYITGVNIKTIKRLLMQSMLIFSIMAFGVSLIQTNTADEFGKLLIFIGILFKLGAVPFHSWIIDIYKHSPIGVIAVTDGVFKIVLTAIFVRFVSIAHIRFEPLIHTLGYISLTIGAILALREHNIKKWLGCLSIGHIGVVLCATSIVQTNLSIAVIIYLLAYGACVICFAFVKNNILKILILFAMLGLPPFHTFFAKVNLIEELLKQNCMCNLSAIIIYFVIELISAIRYIRFFLKTKNFDKNKIIIL